LRAAVAEVRIDPPHHAPSGRGNTPGRHAVATRIHLAEWLTGSAPSRVPSMSPFPWAASESLRATLTGHTDACRAPRCGEQVVPGPVGGGGRPAWSRRSRRRGPATGWSGLPRAGGAVRPVDNDLRWAASPPRVGPKAAGAHLPPARKGLGGGARLVRSRAPNRFPGW
jgi:hypothetical protein